MNKIYIEVGENAKLPTLGSPGAAGFDLYASQDMTLSAMTPTIVSTAIKIAIPEGFYGRVAPRSGLAVKGVDVLAGVIDSDYRGNVGVVLVYLSSDPAKTFLVNKGDRIAQLIIEPCVTDVMWVTGSLDNTKRAAGGFGSTGV